MDDIDDMEEVITDFLVESHENLDRLDRDFVAFESDPSQKGLLPAIFRAIHTIKGTCGFLGYSKLEALSHVGETLLGKLRDGTLAPTQARITTLLAMVDAIRAMLHSIETNRNDGTDDNHALREALTALLTDAPAVVASPDAAAPVPDSQPVPNPQPVPVPQLLAPLPPAQTASKPAPSDTASASASATESSVRVDVALLGKLMNLVGELVLTRNQLLQCTNQGGDPGLMAATQRLNLITSELQEEVMRTRMQTVGTVWAKFPRLVRDLCASCGKQVRLEMDGQDTEVDRTLLDAIKDPLTHIIRNAVDHGIETPARRLAAGKPAEGTLSLRAFHEGGQVNIEIVDDGGGIPLDRIRKKAIERGLITPEAAARMLDQDVINLIFVPGFSTAEAVTNVSGRGVGMDVVRTNIEQVGGAIVLESREGEGTRIRIRIPLTLAIVPALIIECNGDRYAIPQVNLVELVRIEPEDVDRVVEHVHDVPVIRRRGKLLPILTLARELALPLEKNEGAVSLVVLQAADQCFGIIVDTICDTAEIVVKPLGRMLKDIGVYAGATIMGDGGVALILDVIGLATRAGLLGESSAGFRAEAAASAVATTGEGKQRVLVVGSRDDARIAMPLDHVERLEEIPAAMVERTGSQEVTQYRGGILPLVRLARVLTERRTHPRHGSTWGPPEGDLLPVILYSFNGRSVGIIVEQIHDIVEEELTARRPAVRAGVLFSVVLLGRVTEMIDLEWVVASLERPSPAFHRAASPRNTTASGAE